MNVGLDEKDYLATLRGLWDKARPKGGTSIPIVLLPSE